MVSRILVLTYVVICLLTDINRHEFYVSISHVIQKENAIELDCRVFADDILLAIGDQIDGSTNDSLVCNTTLEYLQRHMQINLNGQKLLMERQRCFMEGDGRLKTIRCLLRCEIPPIEIISVQITSTVLIEQLEDQINMIHLEFAQKRKSKNLDKDRRSFTVTI